MGTVREPAPMRNLPRRSGVLWLPSQARQPAGSASGARKNGAIMPTWGTIRLVPPRGVRATRIMQSQSESENGRSSGGSQTPYRRIDVGGLGACGGCALEAPETC